MYFFLISDNIILSFILGFSGDKSKLTILIMDILALDKEWQDFC